MVPFLIYNSRYRNTLLFTAVLLTCTLSSHCARPQSTLDLAPATGDVTINTFSFSLDDKKLKLVHTAKGKKLSLPVQEAIINNHTVDIDRFRIRGSTSSHYHRKSYNIVLGHKAPFHERDTVTLMLKKLYAICLNMDRNYIRNKIAYAVLADQGVVVPPHVYVNMVANSTSEGIYLFFYPPADFALKELNSPFVIRRGYNASIKKSYEKDLPVEEAKDLSQRFYAVYKKILPLYKGTELYNRLNAVIDMENYFTWLAFNHLFQNGDYTDEAYFMWNTRKQKFELIPWDFDDLFQLKPHGDSPIVRAKLIFSVEDRLDEAIVNDPYLYAQYLRVYKGFLEHFTKEKLKTTLEHVYQQVLPYFMQEGILVQTRFDKYGQTDIPNLQKDLNSIYNHVLLRIDFVSKELAKAIQ